MPLVTVKLAADEDSKRVMWEDTLLPPGADDCWLGGVRAHVAEIPEETRDRWLLAERADRAAQLEMSEMLRAAGRATVTGATDCTPPDDSVCWCCGSEAFFRDPVTQYDWCSPCKFTGCEACA